MTEEAEPAPAPPLRRLILRRNFGLFWWAGMISNPGNWVHNVTASVVILKMTGDPVMVGVVNFASFIPVLLLAPLAGSLGDRFDRRAMVGICAAMASLFAGLLAVLSATGHLAPWSLILGCFLIGTMVAMLQPPYSAMVPSLVERDEVRQATALNVMAYQFGQVAGPGLASAILLLASPTWAFSINSLSFLGPVVAMSLIRLPSNARRQQSGKSGSRVLDGLRFLWRTPTLPATLAMVVLVNASTEALRTLAPTIAHNLGDAAYAGVIILGSSCGAIAGLLGFGFVDRRMRASHMLPLAFGLQVVGTTAVGIAPGLLLTSLCAIPIGLGFSFSVPLLSAHLQTSSPDEMRSRVMATYTMAHVGLRPVFSLLAGFLAAGVGTSAALYVFAGIAALAMLWSTRLDVFRDDPVPA